jgi:hypothetical protein
MDRAWHDARNIPIDHRWEEAMRTTFASMQRKITLGPDAILASVT